MTMSPARRVGTTVGAAEAGRRLDLWLAAQLPDLSRTRIRALVDGGHVSVNGAARKAAHRLKAGERVEAVVPPPAPSAMAAESIPLTIVYEDVHVLVVDKPAGMVTH